MTDSAQVGMTGMDAEIFEQIGWHRDRLAAAAGIYLHNPCPLSPDVTVSLAALRDDLAAITERLAPR